MLTGLLVAGALFTAGWLAGRYGDQDPWLHRLNAAAWLLAALVILAVKADDLAGATEPMHRFAQFVIIAAVGAIVLYKVQSAERAHDAAANDGSAERPFRSRHL